MVAKSTANVNMKHDPLEFEINPLKSNEHLLKRSLFFKLLIFDSLFFNIVLDFFEEFFLNFELSVNEN